MHWDWLSKEEELEISRAIDAYAWKHSWHLPKTEGGYTDWSKDETLAKCEEVLTKYHESARQFSEKCERLVNRLRCVRAARLRDEDAE